MRILDRFISTSHSPLLRGPFTATIQARFKKLANTAQTRLETRTRDPKLDLFAFHHCRLALILGLYSLVSAKKRGALCVLTAPLPVGPARRRQYPLCRRVSSEVPTCFSEQIVCNMEDVNVIKIRRILLMSVNGKIHLHAIRLMRRELGLPENFRESIIRKHSEIFRMIDLEIVELVDWNENERTLSCSAEVEKWREKDYNEKWLSEFETKYAFPINFPTGFKIVPGFRERLRNWQRLSYVKPYERVEKVRVRTCGGVERYEKRAVGIIHELLCLTVEKMVEVERLAHFRKDLGIEVNLRELLLKHPGIFYISTRGNTLMVFLREAYSGGYLVEPNTICDVRRKMLELLLLSCRNTRKLREQEEDGEDRKYAANDENGGGRKDGDFVIPILESYSGNNHGCYFKGNVDLYEKEDS
ncbi:protein ROOT PRIMORDIUM defective [Sesamum alatum]|uniref:Protein ROOT PRIMORDIUM defective n=1 Tax=Sesamum alatum TaxID=300844 RepID=A0AAE1XN76_9LAMI|nr:protein ROOT PRIMORDIUM defective [Sesamum alatum]